MTHDSRYFRDGGDRREPWPDPTIVVSTFELGRAVCVRLFTLFTGAFFVLLISNRPICANTFYRDRLIAAMMAKKSVAFELYELNFFSSIFFFFLFVFCFFFPFFFEQILMV